MNKNEVVIPHLLDPLSSPVCTLCQYIYAVPKPGSTNLRLVNDHSTGPYALNSMIDHSLVTGYPLDNLHQLGNMLLDLHVLTPGLDLVMWKSDIAEAYRMCPMHPLWQIKQAVHIDGEYYIDRANCFGSSASFAIFVSVNSLVAWIAKNDRGVSSLITYVDDSSSPSSPRTRSFTIPTTVTFLPLRFLSLVSGMN